MNNVSSRFARGTVWWCKDSMNTTSRGVQKGRRPALIISSDCRGNSPVVEVVKITKTDKSRTCTSINIPTINPEGMTNYILCNQHFTVNVSDLEEYMYTVSDETMSRVNRGLLTCQGMGDLVKVLDLIDDMRDIDSLTSLISSLHKKGAET